MPLQDRPFFLLVSSNPAIVKIAEPVLQSLGAHVCVAADVAAAEEILAQQKPPMLAVIDTDLGGIDAGWLVTCRACEETNAPTSIVLISDTLSSEQQEMVAAGIVSDLILRAAPPAYWQLRIELVLRTRASKLEMEVLRNAEGNQTQIAPVADILNHEAILSLLFRETDRVQRLNSPLSVVLFALDDDAHSAAETRVIAPDALFRAVAERTARVLRSYDAIGCTENREFLLVLPGCSIVDARAMAERLSRNIFGGPFRIANSSIWPSACFGVATSLGRSPIVVLREAEQALERARADGPGSIESFSLRATQVLASCNLSIKRNELPL